MLARLADTTASVYVVPDFFVFELLHSRWTNIGGLPAVSIFETPLYGVGGAIKRVIDVVAGLGVSGPRGSCRCWRLPWRSSSPRAGRCSSSKSAMAWMAGRSTSGNSAA